MKILVTGAAGFIGSHLAERLANLGHDVVGVDSYTDFYPAVLKRLNAASAVRAGAMVLDLDLVTDDLAPILDGVEVVYHLAAQPGNSATTTLKTYMDNNIVATYRLLEGVRKSKSLKSFINIATSSVYGQHATDGEDVAAKPTSNYGVTKLAAEQLALVYHREQSLPVTSLRLFSVYGPRERPDKLYPKLMRAILEGSEFPLFEGSDLHSRSFTFVDDIIDGFVAVLNHLDRCHGEIFNIGSDIEITTGEGMRIVQELMGKQAKIKILPKRPGDQLKTHANIAKARRVLNYVPRTAPREGLAKEIEWYKNEIFGKVTY